MAEEARSAKVEEAFTLLLEALAEEYQSLAMSLSTIALEEGVDAIEPIRQRLRLLEWLQEQMAARAGETVVCVLAKRGNARW